MSKTVATWLKEHLTTIARIGTVTVFLLLAMWAITLQHYNLVIGYSGLAQWLTTALIDVAPELAGIVIGVVTIDYLNERRQDEQLKEQLILQMGSRHNDVTDTAIRILQAKKWLYDGSLQGADLKDANLEGAYLAGAKLERAVLLGANLEGVTDWTMEQLRQAEFLEGATMPDGTRLYHAESDPESITFEAWAALQEAGDGEADSGDEGEWTEV